MRRTLIAVLALAVLAVGPARAESVPSPGTSLLPTHILLGACAGPVPDPAVGFEVIARDLASNPIPGAEVAIDLAACEDLVLGALAGPGVTVDCARRRATAITDAAGRARFVLTGATSDRTRPGSGALGHILISGVLAGQVVVAAPDADGRDGIGAHDLHLWLQDFIGLGYAARADFDGDLALGASDLNLLLALAGSDGAAHSAPRCDGGGTTRPVQLAGQADLTWTDCPASGGTTLRTFACTSNTGTDAVVATAVLPDAVADVLGFEAELEVFAPFVPVLPDYWRVDAAGCQSLRDRFTPDALGGTGCADPFAGQLIGGATRAEPVPGDPSRLRLHLMGAVTEGVGFASGMPQAVFLEAFSRARSAGAGACSGCTQPVSIALRALRLARGAAGATTPTTPDLEVPATGTVYWQQMFGATTTTPASWGALKLRYR